MKTYFLDVICKHYLDFGGRATRTQYWLYVLFYFIVAIVLSVLCHFLGRVGSAITNLYGLALLLPSLGIAARRLRDGGFSPWLLLLLLLPFIGWLILLVLYLLPSKN